jgi:hypothetical protein
MNAADLGTPAANWREIVLPHDTRLKVTSIDGATALLRAESIMAG